jgi:hypothetical protein
VVAACGEPSHSPNHARPKRSYGVYDASGPHGADHRAMQISVGSRPLATGYRAVPASDRRATAVLPPCCRRATAVADCGDDTRTTERNAMPSLLHGELAACARRRERRSPSASRAAEGSAECVYHPGGNRPRKNPRTRAHQQLRALTDPLREPHPSSMAPAPSDLGPDAKPDCGRLGKHCGPPVTMTARTSQPRHAVCYRCMVGVGCLQGGR